MEESQKHPTDANTTPAVDSGNNPETKVRDPEAVLAKNRELLGDVKSLKEELNNLREFKNSIEIEKKERKGEYQDIIAKFREENNKLKDQLKERDSRSAYKALKNQFAQEAKELGCQDAETFFEIAMTKHKDEFAGISFDENEEKYPQEYLRDVTEKLKESYPYMFTSKSVNHTPVRVNGVVNTTGNKDLKDMSQGELMAMWKQMES